MAGNNNDHLRDRMPKTYYDTPIDKSEGRLSGYSRDWGKASPQVKEAVRDYLISQAKAKGMNDEQIAHMLSVVEHESGFNPDAASKGSTASGLGQFTRGTWKDHGNMTKNVFDAEANSDATINYYLKSRDAALDNQEDGSSVWDHTYRYYHDGLNSKNPESIASQSANTKIMGYFPGNQEYLRTLEARARMAEAVGGWSQAEPMEPVESLDEVPEYGNEDAVIRPAGVFGNPFDLGPGIDGAEAMAPDASAAGRVGSGGPSYVWAGADALFGKLVDPAGDGGRSQGGWGLRPFRGLGYPGGLPDPRVFLGQGMSGVDGMEALPEPGEV